MVCEHLVQLERELLEAGIKVTYRGQAWSKNCREFVYFDCILDRNKIRERLCFPDCVKDHEHVGTHSGSESGFYCAQCKDGIMGYHHKAKRNCRVFT